MRPTAGLPYSTQSLGGQLAFCQPSQCHPPGRSPRGTQPLLPTLTGSSAVPEPPSKLGCTPHHEDASTDVPQEEERCCGCSREHCRGEGRLPRQKPQHTDLRLRNGPANRLHAETSFCKRTRQVKKKSRAVPGPGTKAERGDKPADHREYSQVAWLPSAHPLQSDQPQEREGRSVLETQQCTEASKILPGSRPAAASLPTGTGCQGAARGATTFCALRQARSCSSHNCILI